MMIDMKGEYRRTPEASAWGKTWYEQHWFGPRPSHLSSDRFAGYLSRKQTHMHKLAMVLAAAKRQTLSITEEDLIESLECLTGIESDMQNVFSAIGVTQSAKTTGEVLSLLRNHKQISYKELWRLCINTMAAKDFTDAIKGAAAAGYIRIEPSNGSPTDKILRYTGPIKGDMPNNRHGP